MKIDDHPVPKPVVLAWCAALARLPDAKARSLASEQGLGAGFRANKMSPDVARSRLRSALEGYAELPEKIRLALRMVSPARPAPSSCRYPTSWSWSSPAC